MSFLNNDDNFHDLRRQEEYERQKNEAVVRGIGHFIYKLYINVFIFFVFYLIQSLLLNELTDMQEGVITLITFVTSFFIFKIPYVKLYPWKSFLTLCFLLFLVFVLMDYWELLRIKIYPLEDIASLHIF